MPVYGDNSSDRTVTTDIAQKRPGTLGAAGIIFAANAEKSAGRDSLFCSKCGSKNS